MITLYLPRESLTGNTLAYRHWRLRYADKIAWKTLIGAEVARAGKRITRATGHRHVSFISYRRRRIDDDNLIAGLKHCRDMLVYYWLIIDDDRKHASFEYVDQPAKLSPMRKPCTVILIEETLPPA